MERNAMKQYLDFYTEQREVIYAHSSAVLNDRREEAFNDFCRLGFAASRKDVYKTFDLERLFSGELGMNIKRLASPFESGREFRCDVPDITDTIYYVVNDRFYGTAGNLPEGVIFCGLHEAAEQYPDLVRRYYGRQVQTSEDGVLAFNMAFAQDGFFLYLPENMQLEKPIQLVNVVHGKKDLMVNSHNLVVLEAGARATLLVCDHTMTGDVRFVSNCITEVFVGKGATYDHYKMESTQQQTASLCSLLIEQQQVSNVLANVITLHNGATRNNIRIRLAGELARTTLCGMAIGDKTQQIDNATVIEHLVPECESRELFKYILDDRSSGSFFGRILVDKGAQKTVALQTNRNLCLTREATMRTQPQLEIYADDVKCSHGATVGQLDDAALFYLRSRGISEAEAKQLLMFAFVSDVLENIRIPSLKDRVSRLVERRLRREDARCNGCVVCR